MATTASPILNSSVNHEIVNFTQYHRTASNFLRNSRILIWQPHVYQAMIHFFSAPGSSEDEPVLMSLEISGKTDVCAPHTEN